MLMGDAGERATASGEREDAAKLRLKSTPIARLLGPISLSVSPTRSTGCSTRRVDGYS
jgi:hypothetical protein